MKSTIPPAPLPPALPELSQQALEALLDVFSAMRGHMRDALRDSADMVAPMHLRMLKHCMQHPGASQQTLVQASGRDKGQVARLVKELEAQGLLLREADPQDGRSQLLKVTPAGRAACQRFRKHEAAIAQRMFATMTARDMQALITQLAGVRSRLGAGEEGGAPQVPG